MSATATEYVTIKNNIPQIRNYEWTHLLVTHFFKLKLISFISKFYNIEADKIV